MQDISKKDSDQSSTYSISHGAVSCPIWWTSAGSQIPQSCLSKSVSLNMDSSHQDCRSVKQLGFQLQDQDSSSTQSTGQSHHEMSNMRGSNPNGQSISVQSEDVETYAKQADGHMKSVLSLGTPEFVQVDYTQSVARLPYPYVDPYFGGLLASYGPQAIIHPQVMGMTTARVPLPLDLAENEPMYVNAKQYRAILRRRQSRAKLEAQNKLIKDRKPYLHESRHLHALKRARGSGGRFLNTKKLEGSKQNPASNGHNTSNSALLQLGGNLSESEFSNTGGASTTSCSDVTTSSNSDNIFRQQDLRFSGYPHLGGTVQDGGGGIMCNGSRHRVPVTQ
ncbi:CCAAT-binding transcription factor [Macleaya cordata]|uniref:Nuclear transcription factor Y subunit n=1 Tax=Macleaya cordata TaxID=56857 RepID=A0A200QEL0_MACCD|nr:CCAAT-binding transcription factor [Macleaya cordata]